MARLLKDDCPGDWSFREGVPVAREFDRHRQLMDTLEQSQPDADARDLAGALVYFPIADGHAIYIVARTSPLQLRHVPYGDAWRVAEYVIRGFSEEDVRAQLRGRRFWAARA